MNRRESLKMLMAASGALVALPAWASEWTPNQVTVHHSSFSLTEQELLTAVADTIIPQGNGIGAISVGVDKFLQKLFDDCYEKDVQDNVKIQLQALEISAQALYAKSFPVCIQSERQELLTKLAISAVKEEMDFFNLIKSETIRGFTTSREVMLNHLNYKQVPGHYYGCIDVKA
jgi:hypothetical protein